MADKFGVVLAFLVVAFLGKATSMTLGTLPTGIGGDTKTLLTLAILLVGAFAYGSAR